jgi:hypothetical protein
LPEIFSELPLQNTVRAFGLLLFAQLQAVFVLPGAPASSAMLAGGIASALDRTLFAVTARPFEEKF